MVLGALTMWLAACGAGGSTPATQSQAPDELSGKSASALVAAAQQYIRSGHYQFTGTGSQRSSGAGLTGMPQEYALAANSGGAWSVKGVVAGDHMIDVSGQFDNGQQVYAREVGCSGFGSLDGTAWAASDGDRWVARMLAPSMDDSTVSATTWTDQGASVVGGERTHHLHASVTPESLEGAAPSPGASPVAGLSLVASTLDLWIRDSDASVARMSEHIDMTSDLAQFRDAQHPDAGGTVHSVVNSDLSMVPASVSVASPTVSLPGDPIPASVAYAFGPFGVQTDNCTQPGGSATS